MSRQWVLVFLFLMIVFTSQFEWKQQFGNEAELKPSSSSKEDIGQREEVVKEKLSCLLFQLCIGYFLFTVFLLCCKFRADKIVLQQERNIQKLKELVKNLRRHLLYCRGDSINGTNVPFDEMLTKLNQLPTLKD